MFNWVLNTPLNFDLFYLLLVNIWKWLVCLVPWEMFFSLSSMQFRSIHGFLSDDISQIESKKQAQWFSNILMCDIRCLDNCPRRKVSPVRVSFRIRGGQFSSGKIVLEPRNSLFKIGENSLKFIVFIISLLDHEPVCLMRLIEHIHWWRVLINEHWKDRQEYS